MTNRFSLLLSTFFLLFGFTAKSQTTINIKPQPTYAGTVEYTYGGFGGYDYPLITDSVFVFIYEKQAVTVAVCPPGNRNLRHFAVKMNDMKAVKTKEYQNIITPDKIIPTGNYDMEFSFGGEKKDASKTTINLTHFGDGTTAKLTIVVEDDNIRMNDILIANLVKVK